MQANPYEEWKHYGEVKLLEAHVDKILDEREKMRVEIDHAKIRWDK